MIPWIVIGSLLTLFTLREFYYLLEPPSRFYPGTAFLEQRAISFGDMVTGTLKSLGILARGGTLAFDPLRSLYLFAAIALLIRFRHKLVFQKRRLMVYTAPLSILCLPLALQILLGYRTEEDFSKPFALCIFLFSWYPAYVFSQIVPSGILMRNRKMVVAVGGILCIASAVVVAPRLEQIRFNRGHILLRQSS